MKLEKKVKTLLLITCVIGLSLISPCYGDETIDRIIAKVDYGVITQTDLLEASAPSVQQIKQNYPPEKWDEMIAEIRQRILMTMINEYVCVRFARENEIVTTDAEIDSAVKNIRENAGIMSEKEFQKELAKEGLTLDEMKESMKRQTIVRKVLRREVYSKARVTEAEIKTFWQENADQFQTSAKVRAGVLMLDTESWGLSTKEKAREKANEIYNQLKNGSDFAEMVKRHSDGPEKENGGDIGFLEKGKTLPVIEEAAFSMEEEEISMPLETDFGFVIVKVLEKIDAGVRDISEVRDQIEQVIRSQKTRDLEAEWFEKQRAKTYIQMFETD